MNLLSVRCNHCGAPLEVSESARFLTCQFCNSSLAIQRTESAISTEALGDIHRNTEHITGELKIIRLQNEIERLDREWQIARE